MDEEKEIKEIEEYLEWEKYLFKSMVSVLIALIIPKIFEMETIYIYVFTGFFSIMAIVYALRMAGLFRPEKKIRKLKLKLMKKKNE